MLPPKQDLIQVGNPVFMRNTAGELVVVGEIVDTDLADNKWVRVMYTEELLSRWRFGGYYDFTPDRQRLRTYDAFKGGERYSVRLTGEKFVEIVVLSTK